ncbi:unnamed protein product [Amoebophrya sp. A25]|nr:unnamed protein product [Amoebophrya sp. A25]|eukprot:GSA25T00015551001.1
MATNTSINSSNPPRLASVVGFNADLGVFPFEEKLIYAAGNVVVAAEGPAQVFMPLASPITALTLCKSGLVESAVPVSAIVPLVAAAGAPTGNTFTELRVFADFGKGSYGPLCHHMTEIDQLAFTADGSKLISIERNRTMCVWDLVGKGLGNSTTRRNASHDKPLHVVTCVQSSSLVPSGLRAVHGITPLPVLSTWDNVVNFSSELRYRPTGKNALVADRSTRSEKTACPVEGRYFYKVRIPGERPPLRFVTWGAQTATKFYSIDRRHPKQALCVSKASFNCEELNLTNTGVEQHVVTSCCVLADGVHTLLGVQNSQVFFFEDAQALRVFAPPAAPGPSFAITSLVLVGNSEDSASSSGTVAVGLASGQILSVGEGFFFEEVSRHLSIRGPSAAGGGGRGSVPGRKASVPARSHVYANSKMPAVLPADSVLDVTSGVGNPSVMLQGRAVETNAFEISAAKVMIAKDRSPRKRVLQSMERKALQFRKDAATLQSTLNDKKCITATHVMKKKKAAVDYDYIVASKSHVFMVSGNDARVAMAQPRAEATGICLVPPTSVFERNSPQQVKTSYAIGSVDGWVHFSDRTPIQVPGGHAVHSVCSTYQPEGTPAYGPPEYLGAGCADSKLFIFAFPNLSRPIFQRALGSSGTDQLTSCAFSPFNNAQKTYQVACGSAEGLVYLLTLTNDSWTSVHTTTKMNSHASVRAAGGIVDGRPERSGEPSSSFAAQRDQILSGILANNSDLSLLPGPKGVLHLRGHVAPGVQRCGFSSCGNFLMTVGFDGRRIAYETHSGQRLPSISLLAEVKFLDKSLLNYNGPVVLGSNDSGVLEGGEGTTSCNEQEGGLSTSFYVEENAKKASSSQGGEPGQASKTKNSFAFAPRSRTAAGASHAAADGSAYLAQLSAGSKNAQLMIHPHSRSVHHSVLTYNKSKIQPNPTAAQGRRPTTSYTTLSAAKKSVTPVYEKVLAASSRSKGAATRVSGTKVAGGITSSFGPLPCCSDSSIGAVVQSGESLIVSLKGKQQQFIYQI